MPEQYPLRESIVADTESAIREGRLHPGDPLPTVRDLAARLGVSPTTVAAAYRELRSRGTTTGNGRAGTTVAPAPPVGPRPGPVAPPGTRDLLAGVPDPALLPELPIAHPPRRSYNAGPVLPRLAELAAAQLAGDGIDCTHLAVVGGAMDGIERALGAWLHPGDRVGVEDPGYSSVLDLLAALTLVPVPISIDDRGADPNSLAKVLDSGLGAVVFTPRAQNPTGSAWDDDRAGELVAVLSRHPGTLVIEDDHAGPVAGVPAVTLGAPTGRQATIRSVSKSLGPDLRLALLTGDAATVARVEGRQALGAGWVSWLLQETVAELWSNPATPHLLEHAAATYRERRQALLRALAGEGFDVTGRSGLSVWIPVNDESSMVSGLLERGWAVSPGARYRIRTPPAIRIGVGTLLPDESARFARDLSEVVRRPSRRSD